MDRRGSGAISAPWSKPNEMKPIRVPCVNQFRDRAYGVRPGDVCVDRFRPNLTVLVLGLTNDNNQVSVAEINKPDDAFFCVAEWLVPIIKVEDRTEYLVDLSSKLRSSAAALDRWITGLSLGDPTAKLNIRIEEAALLAIGKEVELLSKTCTTFDPE